MIDEDYQEKIKEYTHLKRLQLMEKLWLLDFKNSIQYFEMAFKISAKEDIKRYLKLVADDQNLPIGNWLYCMKADGTLVKNPLWNPNL